jgi:hypothetical protein
VQLKDSTEDPPLHGKATKAVSDPQPARVDTVAEQQGVVKEAREDPPEGSVPPKPLQVAQSVDVRPAEKTPEGEDGAKSCHFQPIESPLSGLEMEIIRIWNISAAVMAEIGATYWPTDGTLLGLMRNGRVATDRDIDLQIHTTKDKCAGLLNSLKPLFAKRCELQSFKVVNVKKGSKIGRYAMVRMHRKFGTFSTGVDFNCVYFDIPDQPHFYTHKGEYTRVPPAVYPLGKCLFYGQEVPCPKDGYAVLEALKPRYEGCMVFPHCIGDPTVSTSKCLSPHPVIPLKRFVETTTQLAECGYTSLRDHFKRESSCQQMLEQADQLSIRNCETHNGKQICFIQSFKG